MTSLWKGILPRGKKNPCWPLFFILIALSLPAFSAHQLQDIKFSAENDDVTRMKMTFDASEVLTSFDKKNKKLVLLLKDTRVKAGLMKQGKIKNAGSLVQSWAVASEGKDLKVTVQNTASFGYDYYQNAKTLIVEFFPLVSAPTKRKDTSRVDVNSNISINFQDIPIRAVLQMVAEHNNFNLVVSDAVKGSLTLRLDDVPWEKALKTILKVKGLGQRQIGNILLIAPKTELDEQERQLMEMQKTEDELASLRSEVIKINYADANEFKNMLGGVDDDDVVSLLSSRGSVGVDLRTNSLIVKDLADNIEVIKSVISSLDIPVHQVEIEARIVTVDEGTLDEIGVRWGVSNTNGSFTTGGSIEGNLGLDYEQKTGDNASSSDNNSNTQRVDDFLNVNLGAVSPNAGSIAFQVANLGKDLLIDLELSALQAESRAEIISSPRLLTTNKRPAYIEQGTELPYLEASSSGATAVSFKKAVLSLSVTPQITNDNKLVLDLEVTQDKPAITVKSGTGEAMSISTQRIGTQVLVNDGETIVLGGIYQHEMQENEDKIPLLGDIPFIGQLFRRNYETMGKRELLIFVTPRIMLQ